VPTPSLYPNLATDAAITTTAFATFNTHSSIVPAVGPVTTHGTCTAVAAGAALQGQIKAKEVSAQETKTKVPKGKNQTEMCSYVPCMPVRSS